MLQFILELQETVRRFCFVSCALGVTGFSAPGAWMMNLCRCEARPLAVSATYTARLRLPPRVAVTGAADSAMSCGECTPPSSHESSTPEPVAWGWI